MMGILKEYDPELESHGLDEANLDITDALLAHEIDIHDVEYTLYKELKSKELC